MIIPDDDWCFAWLLSSGMQWDRTSANSGNSRDSNQELGLLGPANMSGLWQASPLARFQKLVCHGYTN